MYTFFSSALLALSISFVSALPNPTPTVPQLASRTDVTIADGNSFQTGTLASGLKWQASGFLESGGCSSTLQFIKDCYELTLTNDPNSQLQPNAASPRQRVEFLNNRGADGTSWHFTWRSYLASYVTGSTTFFHTMQIFSAGDDAPAYFTDLLSSKLSFKDYSTGETLASVSVSETIARSLQHTLDVTYGPSGKVHYTIADSQTGEVLLNYQSGTRSVGTGGTYLKFGAYRATFDGMSKVKAWYGDYTGSQK